MIQMTLADVATATGGDLSSAADPQASVSGLVIDSRQAGPGVLFAALAGERTDGHLHVEGAFAAGAVAALVSRPVPGPAIVVDDVANAMGQLASEVLRRSPHIRVIAVTGSSGKTSTKDLVAGLLEASGPTVAPPGSYNNELGTPLTVLRTDAATRFLVLEMGARGRGHIARLAAMAPPSIGMVLNVGSAHLGEFGSRQAIAQAKGELAEAARDVAVLNADDDLVAAMAARARARVVTFGESARADVRATGVDIDDLGRARFTLRTPSGDAAVRLQLIGAHHVSNALAAAAAALECGRTVEQIAAGLSSATARSRWRMEVATSLRGQTILNDAYNANPESVRAALKTLAVLGRAAAGRPARRTVAVLGPMYELGPASLDEHDATGRLAARLDVGKLVVVGPDAAAIHTGAHLEGSGGAESVLVADVDEALRVLAQELRDDDVVLIKASRAAGLERIAEALLAAPAGAGG